MYHRRGNQHHVGPRGLHPGQGSGRGGSLGGMGEVPLLQQQLQIAGGRLGVRGGTMLGMHSGINTTLNPANRGPPGISAAALRGGAAGLMHSQQLPQNMMASAAERLIANQIQQKQQLQQLQLQQQRNIHQNQLHLQQQQHNMRQNQLQQQQQNLQHSQLHLQQQQTIRQAQLHVQQQQQQQQQQNIRHSRLQHHLPRRSGVTPSHSLNTPGLPANNLGMSQPGLGQSCSLQPSLSKQCIDGPGPRGGPVLNNQRAKDHMRSTGGQPDLYPKERDRSLSQDRKYRSSENSRHFDKQDRDGRTGMREDRYQRKSELNQDHRRRVASSDRRSNCSYGGSDSLSNTERNSRGSSASRESASLSQRKSQKSSTEKDLNHRYASSRSSTSKDKGSRGKNYDRTGARGRVRGDDRDSRVSQRSVSSSGSGKRPREDDSKERLSRDEKDRAGTKRKHEDSKDIEEEKLPDRERRGAKRLRPDSRESKPEKGEASAETKLKESTPSWIRCSPADLYFMRNAEGAVRGTPKMKELEELFEEKLIARGEGARASMPKLEPPPLPTVPCHYHHHHHHGSDGSCSSSDCSSDDSDSDDDSELCSKWMEEMERKRKHQSRLHSELWGNDNGQMNNGPLCRCSIKARRSGIRHDIYPGETHIEPCDPSSSNMGGLHHYRITMAPSTNFLSNSPTVIDFDNNEFIFEGFSLFTHEKLDNIPLCKVIRFHIEYTIHFLEEPAPENFTVGSLDLFTRFLFTEILELVDLDWKGAGGGCNRFHLLPRFARSLPENGKEVLSMNEVLKYLLQSSCPLVDDSQLPMIRKLDREAWQSWVETVCGTIVTCPGKKPSSIRVDQLDRTKLQEGEDNVMPLLVHFGIRPAQLSYAGNPEYQKAWKQYIKFKHLLNSKPKVLSEDKEKLKSKEEVLQEIQAKNAMKREVTVELSTQGFLRTGLKSDVCQHALLLPVLLSHIRFHRCLCVLEQRMSYAFKDRSLLQLALTHTSFRNNYGTNSSHARNSLTNCGLRQVEYGDRRVYYQNTRKRGINILVDIMSRLGRREETMSEIPHNERLEFLGDAVVEFLSSVHLFFMFHWLEEGGLSTYRTALVQNQHLSVLAKNLHLQDFMLYVHGPDLCHESDLRHAMANCFEALMGALFMDGGLETVDRIFGNTLFGEDPLCLKMWQNLPLHPLQEDEPGGDRHWVESSPALQKLITFEMSTGLSFNHVRLLAKAFTHRNVGSDNLLTMGHNQRLEFLGDTVLQLIASEYLFKYFPEHHEGHLSLLRSSLVNSRTQSIVCDDLGMTDYVIYEKSNERGQDIGEMKTKQKADLLEALLGALYVDSGLESCRLLCNVCFFPRLKDFILNQDWNDPKSQLQQCCLTLRKMGAGEPDIPFYKVIESLGPSNTRKYVVAVYFRGERLATGTGHSIQQAEMSAANNALQIRSELFPILKHQKRFLEPRQKDFDRRRQPRQYRIGVTAKKNKAPVRANRSRKSAAPPSTPSSGHSRSSSASSTVAGSSRSQRRSDSRESKSTNSRDNKPSESSGRKSSLSRSSERSRSDSYSSRKRSPFSPPVSKSRPSSKSVNHRSGSSSPGVSQCSGSLCVAGFSRLDAVGRCADSPSLSSSETSSVQHSDTSAASLSSPSASQAEQLPAS